MNEGRQVVAIQTDRDMRILAMGFHNGVESEKWKRKSPWWKYVWCFYFVLLSAYYVCDQLDQAGLL